MSWETYFDKTETRGQGHTYFPIVCQLANNCGNVSFYYSCFSFLIVSRCSSVSVAHFWSSKKAKLTVTHNIYWSALKSLSRSAAALFPKSISNFRSHNNRQEAKTCLFWDFFIIIRMMSSLPNWGSYSELFECILLEQSRACLFSDVHATIR